MSVWPQAALLAGLGQIAPNAATAVMEDCATLQRETAAVVWAGQGNTATSVTNLNTFVQ